MTMYERKTQTSKNQLRVWLNLLKLRGLVFQALVYLEEESPGTLETENRDSFITLTESQNGDALVRLLRDRDQELIDRYPWALDLLGDDFTTSEAIELLLKSEHLEWLDEDETVGASIIQITNYWKSMKTPHTRFLTSLNVPI